MSSHVAFLRAIAETPTSALDRFAYADWLDEQGEPLAEVLRVQALVLRPSEGGPPLEDLAVAERQLLVWYRRRGEWLCGELAPWPDAARALRGLVLTPLSPAPERLVCPTCGISEHRRHDLRDPRTLAWVLNPGSIFSEVLLGEHLPAVGYECKGCGDLFVRCPACRAYHREEDVHTAWMNWAGYRCLCCGAHIQLLRSAAWRAADLTVRLLTGYGWLWGRHQGPS